MLAGLSRPMPNMGMGGMSNMQGNGHSNQGWNGGMPKMNRNHKPYQRKGDDFDPKAGDSPNKANEESYSVDTKGEPGQVGDTRVPYYEISPQVLRRNEATVDTDNVPPAERQRVKQYFDALNPNAEQ